MSILDMGNGNRSFRPDHPLFVALRHGGSLMHKLILVCSLFLVACAFDPSGAPLGLDVDGSVGDDVDGAVDDDAGTDAGSAPDASPDAMTCPSDQVLTPDGCQPRPHIHCSLDTDSNGVRWRVLDFTGWITYGLLGDAPSGATPSYIAYGSDFDSSAIQSSCNGANRWLIPYPSGCTAKPQAAWMGEPGTANRLRFSENVENFNIAVVYTNGAVRWADIKVDDGDSDGFTVDGIGISSCHVVHPPEGGGIIRIAL
ncbi:MAG: hypothetical protein QY323_02675 [Patescibacteria group bacterium]|nr:MAG: hypothetical protein QY323_02675 [Patescibacteria group bacterium]